MARNGTWYFYFPIARTLAQINDAPLDYSNQIGKSHML